MTSTSPRHRPDSTTLFFMALAAVSAGTLWWRDGPERTLGAFGHAGTLLLGITPILVAALFMGGYAQSLLPRDKIAQWLRESTGTSVYLIAIVAGTLTPAGPFAAFPLVLALRRAGVPFDVCVVYLSAWGALGIHRIVIWELPFLGHDFVMLRVLASLPVPIAAGLLARVLFKNRV
jgi:uncharacterized membrane protein YraQ (UPF0718 family)